MISVKMDLYSAVDYKKYELRTIQIINDGTGTANRGNYKVTLLGKRLQVLRTGKITNWPRKAKTPEQLLMKALEVMEVRT